MRTYGRITNNDGSLSWVEVQTAANGDNSQIYLTTLIQCLKLVLGESPFYANYGIPAIQSVLTQIFPDFYVTQTQSQFAPYFASLLVYKQASATPTYNIACTTLLGAQIALKVPQ